MKIEYKVGDLVMVKSYRQAKIGNGISTNNYITRLVEKGSVPKSKTSGCSGCKECTFLVASDRSDNHWFGIFTEHIIKKITENYEIY